MTTYLVQGECEKCEDRGETHGRDCIVRKVIFNYGKEPPRKWLTEKEARQAAIRAFETAFARDKKPAL